MTARALPPDAGSVEKQPWSRARAVPAHDPVAGSGDTPCPVQADGIASAAGCDHPTHPAPDGPAPTHEKEHLMSITTTPAQPRNGVDVPTLFATIDAVKGDPEIAEFQFRARNQWQGGTHSRSEYHDFFGAKQELAHEQVTVVESDHPAVLVGGDRAPTPVEYLLHAIAACLTSGIANVAAARGVTLTRVSSTVDRATSTCSASSACPTTSATATRSCEVTFHVEGDADDETLRAIVEQSRRRSAVYDALTNPTPVHIEVVTG